MHHASRPPSLAVLVGAAKSGTSTLAKLMSQHPDILIGKEKEPDFFAFDEVYERGIEWYQAQFPPPRAGGIRLDASTSYTRWPQYPHAAARLQRHFPDARLLYLLRHPVERAYSHYVHRFTKELHPGKPFDRTFEQHVAEDPMCVDSSDYRLQIEVYLRYFARESLLCLFTEDLERDECAVAVRACRFLGLACQPTDVPSLPEPDNVSDRHLDGMARTRLATMLKSLPLVERVRPLLPKRLRQATLRAIEGMRLGKAIRRGFTPPPMLPETRRELTERFRPGILWLAEFTGRDLSHWLETSAERQ